MGMFDTVMVGCPKCGEQQEFQSKSGDCILRYYTLETVPDDVIWDINRHSPYECKCGVSYEVDIETKKAIISNERTKTGCFKR